MKTNWDLTVFYKDFDDPAFSADLAALPARIEALSAAVREENADHAAKIVGLIAGYEDLGALFERLGMMIHLTLACDAGHEAANAANAQMMRARVQEAQLESALCRYLASVPNLETLIAENETLRKNDFFLRKSVEGARHSLPEALEGPVLQMQLSGGKSFSQLRDKLDATLEVDYRGEKIPLSAVRAKAYDGDADVRKDAYEA